MINWEHCRGIIPGASTGQFLCLFLRFHSPFHRSLSVSTFRRGLSVSSPICFATGLAGSSAFLPLISIHRQYPSSFFIAPFFVLSLRILCQVGRFLAEYTHTHKHTNKKMLLLPFPSPGSSSLPVCSFSYFSSIPWWPFQVNPVKCGLFAHFCTLRK